TRDLQLGKLTSYQSGLTPLTKSSKNHTISSNALRGLSIDPEYRNWLDQNKNPRYARYIGRRSPQVVDLLFNDDFVVRPNDRNKQDDMRAMGNLCRFHDIKYDTNLHEEFTSWLKKKEIKWRSNINSKNYWMANNVKLEDILSNIRKLPYKYKIFALFVLVSGLRTSEALDVFNHHENICRDNILEIFTDRNTKKSNAVYCHPLLHDMITFQVSSSRIYKNLNSKNLGCEIRYLRKLNFTMVATKIDALLSEFCQGRRGNLSQRAYFLPLMQNNKRKWIRIWESIINRTLL
ncbi:MAG: integrase, partial [Nitrosopumilaceae archaeon]